MTLIKFHVLDRKVGISRFDCYYHLLMVHFDSKEKHQEFTREKIHIVDMFVDGGKVID